MTKDGSLRGQMAVAESVSKAVTKTLIIPAKELVQVIAKVLLYSVSCCLDSDIYIYDCDDVVLSSLPLFMVL